MGGETIRGAGVTAMGSFLALSSGFPRGSGAGDKLLAGFSTGSTGRNWGSSAGLVSDFRIDSTSILFGGGRSCAPSLGGPDAETRIGCLVGTLSSWAIGASFPDFGTARQTVGV